MTITGDFVQGLKDKLGQVIKGAFKPADHTHNMLEVEGLANAMTGKADVEHTQAISTITGLQSGLNGKLGSAITTGSTLNISQDSIGKLFEIVNTNNVALSTLVHAVGGTVIFHLGSAERTNDHFLVRPFRLNVASGTEYFLEVVGAWDNPE